MRLENQALRYAVIDGPEETTTEINANAGDMGKYIQNRHRCREHTRIGWWDVISARAVALFLNNHPDHVLWCTVTPAKRPRREPTPTEPDTPIPTPEMPEKSLEVEEEDGAGVLVEEEQPEEATNQELTDQERAATERDALVRDPGWLRRRPYQYQAYAAYFLLETEGPQRGVLLADEMGLGKTTTVITALATAQMVRVARMVHRLGWRDECRATGPDLDRYPRCPKGPDANPDFRFQCSPRPTLIVVP
ncbi:MAG: hypothetical protein M1826_007481 [Phylliscum demangeonii]|nr:MAG: hypothetical protein M1826_007481 [Phylliscum demangeonii]